MQNQDPDYIENLSGADAIKKLQELIKAQPTCLFASKLIVQPISARPMGTQHVDEQGYIWFFSGKHSLKNQHIAGDPRVQLFYANMGSSEYLSIYGIAEIIVDAAKAKELWNPIAKAWFEEGPTDPELTLLKVKPEEAHYWDTKHGKMITMLKILVSAVTGTKGEDGVEGDLKV